MLQPEVEAFHARLSKVLKMNKTILVVDDKRSVQLLVKDYLTERGFKVVTANNGREALFTARHENPDLILLDIMMPEMDGFEFMRLHRKERETPIILLTAKLDETDKVIGLELGADDYVTKPFGMAELVARIRAVLRRLEKSKSDSDNDILTAGEILLNKQSHMVKASGQSVDLTPSEFDLLAILMASPGRAFSRAELLESLQGNSFEGVERTIDVHIRNLRSKLEIDPANPHYVQTVFGVGYRFNPELDS
ncbi:MAG: response regulator transcription factor [Aggregatilineales bacterium]